MSILIKGVEMPTSCGFCVFEQETGDGCECYINGCLTEYQKRPDDCPLVEIPLWMGEKDPQAASEYAKRGIREKMSDALTDSIKFISKRDFDPRRFEEVITVRGEVWVCDPDAGY